MLHSAWQTACRTAHQAPCRVGQDERGFETITLGFFEKYGIRQAGFWTTLVGESSATLTYMLAWDSLAEREQKWNAFASDPDWLAKRAESEREKPIVATISSQFLVPTSFSSVK
jgi:hypothetical protein